MTVRKGYVLGDTLVAQDLEPDVCKPGDVRIKVVAAGVNAPDLVQALGKYPPPKGASPVLGLEVAGVITEYNTEGVYGSLDGVAVGSPVMALTNGGGYAHDVVVPAAQCLPLTQVHVPADKTTSGWDPASFELVEQRIESLKRELHIDAEDSWPDPMAFVAASVLPETMITVWANVFVERQPLLGQVVLIHGGGGGVGSSAISMCRQAGAVVVTTAHGVDKIAQCLALGADVVIDYHAPSVAAILGEAGCGASLAELSRARCEALSATQWSVTGQLPARVPCFEEGKADQVLDILGAGSLQDNVRALGAQGRLSLIAMQQGSRGELDLMRLMLKRITVTGSTLRSRSPLDKAGLVRSLSESGLVAACTAPATPAPSHAEQTERVERAERAVAAAFSSVDHAHARQQPQLRPLPVIGSVLPLSGAGEALLRVARRETTGKTVLIPQS